MSYQKMCFGQNENEFWMKEGGGLEKVMEIKESGEYVGKSRHIYWNIWLSWSERGIKNKVEIKVKKLEKEEGGYSVLRHSKILIVFKLKRKKLESKRRSQPEKCGKI